MKVGTLIHPVWLAKNLLNPVPGRIVAPLVRSCVAAGARHIEITGEIFTLAPPNLLESLRQEIHDVLVPLKEEQALTFSLHLPTMGGLDISSSIAAIRLASVETYRRLIDLTSPLAPESFVLHVAGMIFELTNSTVTGSYSSTLRQLFLQNVYRSLEDILTFLPPPSLCLENLPAFPMEFLLPLVRDFPVSVCLDIGHLHLRGESLHDFWARFGPRTREIHLHDVKIVRPGPNLLLQHDHHALGEGDLDIEGILDTLNRWAYSGPLVLETLHDPEMRSVGKLRSMLQARGLDST